MGMNENSRCALPSYLSLGRTSYLVPGVLHWYPYQKNNNEQKVRKRQPIILPNTKDTNSLAKYRLAIFITSRYSLMVITKL